MLDEEAEQVETEQGRTATIQGASRAVTPPVLCRTLQFRLLFSHHSGASTKQDQRAGITEAAGGFHSHP